MVFLLASCLKSRELFRKYTIAEIFLKRVFIRSPFQYPPVSWPVVRFIQYLPAIIVLTFPAIQKTKVQFAKKQVSSTLSILGCHWKELKLQVRMLPVRLKSLNRLPQYEGILQFYDNQQIANFKLTKIKIIIILMKKQSTSTDWKQRKFQSFVLKDSVRSSYLLPDISLAKNDKSGQSLPNRLNKMSSSEISKIAEEFQQDTCKLILFPDEQIIDGFRTFTDMMVSNQSWASHAQLMKKVQSDTRLKSEPSYLNCSIFPDYLKNRLQFNQSQAENYSVNMNDKWIQNMENMKTQYLKGAKEEYRLPKVRIAHNDKKTFQLSSDKIIDEEEEENKLYDDNTNNIKLKNLKFFWQEANSNSSLQIRYQLQINENWKPSMREGTTLLYVPSLSKCIMYGGRGKEVFNSIVTLDTATWQWTNLGLGSEDVPLEGRFGHTANCFRRSIVYYGGEKLYNSHLKMRECLSEIRIYNPFDHSWKYPRVFGDVAEGRRNHCAAILNRFLFIFGGINSYGKYLNDVCSLNLETFKWAVYDVEDFYPGGIAFASCIALFRHEIRINNPIIGVEYNKIKGKRPVKLVEEGIYIFGGKLANGDAINELRVLKIGSKIFQTKILEPKGQGPSARYMHTMNYYDTLNLLIIYGGKDDNCQETVKNDMFALDLESLTWISVDHQNKLVIGKCNHCSVFLETKLLIFGGYSQNVYQNSVLNMVEFDQTKSRLMVKETNVGGLNRRNSQQHNSIVFTSKDLQSDQSLKLFAMDGMGSQHLFQNEEENRKKRLKDKEIEKLSFKHFKSFLPLPMRETSALLKEFKLKRELNRQDGSYSLPPSLNKRPSSKKQSFLLNENKTAALEEMQLKIQTSIHKQRLSVQTRIQEINVQPFTPMKETIQEITEEND